MLYRPGRGSLAGTIWSSPVCLRRGAAVMLTLCSPGMAPPLSSTVTTRRKRPDSPAVLTATVRAAVAAASEAASDLPLLAGGKSLGGRMTSLAFAGERSVGIRSGIASLLGLVFFGFPLHPAGRPGIQRAEHLARVQVPMLFLQGTRDALADLVLLRPLCDTLVPLATLHVVDGADHSFHVLKRSGRTDADVLAELGRKVASWADSIDATG